MKGLTEIITKRDLYLDEEGQCWFRPVRLRILRQMWGWTNLLFLVYLVLILSNLPFVPLSLIGETAYIQVVAGAARRLGQPYRLLRRRSFCLSYLVGGEAFSVLGPTRGELTSDSFSLLPLTLTELQALERQTGYDLTQWLAQLDINQQYLVSDLLDDQYYPELVQEVVPWGQLNYIRTDRSCWFSRRVATDVSYLTEGDQLQVLTLTADLQLQHELVLRYSQSGLEWIQEPRDLPLPFWSLVTPRPWVKDRPIFHPFNLSPVRDSFLALILLTQAWIAGW